MQFEIDGMPVETGGREDRLLPWNKVHDMTGISRTTAWRMQQVGQFPAPVPVSSGRVGWWESELTAWKRARGHAKPLKAPGRPKFAGMPRRTPAPDPVPVMEGPKLTTGITIAVENPQPVRKRRMHPVAPGQIDFGF